MDANQEAGQATGMADQASIADGGGPILLDELALRRPTFEPGCRVKLADGQDWTIPRPDAWLVPRLGPDGKLARTTNRRVQAEQVSSFGPDFDRLVNDVQAAESYGDEALALFNLAIDLLGRNYDLTDDHYRALLRYRPGHPDQNRALGDIFAVACGSVPAGSGA